MPEACNGIDDDCDGSVPAGEADGDTDGLRACGGDCYDMNAAAVPGQSSYFDMDRGDGSFDYDCDGTEELRWTMVGNCALDRTDGVGCDFAPGWEVRTVPDCGVRTPFLEDSSQCVFEDRPLGGRCTATPLFRRQECQ
jgi:hypothetical protein